MAGKGDSKRQLSIRPCYSIGTRKFDWTKSGDYPRPDSKDWAHWAWECIRRNQRYQQAYAHFLAHAKHAPTDYPLPDTTPMVHLFARPDPVPGETLGDFQIRTQDQDSTYMPWGKYIERMWLLKRPVDPGIDYTSQMVQFVRLASERWARNIPPLSRKELAKNRKSEKKNIANGEEANRKLPTNADGGPGVWLEEPIDYFTELGPGEIVLRVNLFADRPRYIAQLAERLKTHIRDHRILTDRSAHWSELHIVLRFWEFEKELGSKENARLSLFGDGVSGDGDWNAYLEKLRKRETKKQAASAKSKKTLSSRDKDKRSHADVLEDLDEVFCLKLRAWAREMIEERGFVALIARSQRKKKTKIVENQKA